MQILSNRCSHSIAPVTLFYTSIAALVGSSAFSPAGKIARSSALKMSFEDEIGVLPPTGFWDPLGLSKDIDEATFTKYRTAELKHGRVAMLAVTGYISRLPQDFQEPLTWMVPPLTLFQMESVPSVPSLRWVGCKSLVQSVIGSYSDGIK